MDLNKSTRHSKITGDFAERLVLYWLSKYGFECAYVDHTGIDIIARNPHTERLMGISVKCRSRNRGTETVPVSIPNDNFDKLDKACNAFACEPWFAIVVDAAEDISGYILSKDHLLKLCPLGVQVASWKMGPRSLEQYRADPEIKVFRFATSTTNWWSKPDEGIATDVIEPDENEQNER